MSAPPSAAGDDGVEAAEDSSELPDNALFDIYERYIGDPDAQTDVYVGFALFFGGIALGAVGVLLFLVSPSLAPATEYALREVAFVISAASLPLILLGVVVLLPGDERMRYAALGGSAVCAGAIALFAWSYPQQWNVATGPDYSVQGVAIYSVGLVAVMGATAAALVGHQVERHTATPEAVERAVEPEEEETVTDEQVRRDIDEAMEDAELSWGGVRKSETRRLEFDTDTEGMESNVDQVSAETTRSSGNVDDAVSGLKRLQGGQAETGTGSGTDDQTAALRDLKQRQREQQESSESDSVVGRVSESGGSLIARIKRFLSG